MILVCKDFQFDGKLLGKLGLMSVNFEDDTTLPSSVTREMESTSMNKYKSHTQGFGTTYSDVLTFDIHIMKDIEIYKTQDVQEFSATEYDEIVTWLTSPKNNKRMEITKYDDSVHLVKGYFSSVTPFDVCGRCYGLICTFTCNSPFSYIEKTLIKTIAGATNLLLNNESSELYDYVYPVFEITPTVNEDIYIFNMSDTNMLDYGKITVQTESNTNIQTLMSKVSSYAALENSSVEYVKDSSTHDVLLICGATGLLFYLIDSYGIRKKCTAFYVKATGDYYICNSGFFYCKLLKGLNITLDCDTLSIYDSLDRPILFDKIGIQDEDEIYWQRLAHGNNTILMNGNFNVTIDYLEPKKGALV